MMFAEKLLRVKSNAENKTDRNEARFGHLSSTDIIEELDCGNLVITPLEKINGQYCNIKPASFDISPSCLIMSAKRGKFLKIYSSFIRCRKGFRLPKWQCKSCEFSNTKECKEQLYVYINPRDTVLVLSKEYIQLPHNICGNVLSRVSTVSEGLGHISTTIDPLWSGALLIAISNPSSERVKLVIQDTEAVSIPLATVTLHYLNSPVDAETIYSNHAPARVDILKKYRFDSNENWSRISILKNTFYKLVNIKDYSLTVKLIAELEKMKNISYKEWPEKLSELEKMVCSQKIRDNRFIKTLLWLIPYAKRILLVLAIAALAYAIYPLFTVGYTDAADFKALIFIAVLECVLTIISNAIE